MPSSKDINFVKPEFARHAKSKNNVFGKGVKL